MAKFKTRLIESDTSISNKISAEINRQFITKLPQAMNEIIRSYKPILKSALFKNETVQSIMGGKLRGELGITNSLGKLNNIINTLINNISFKISKRGNKTIIALTIVEEDFLRLTNLSSALQNTQKGGQFNWLDWLLFKGDAVVVHGYEVVPSNSRASRTGLAIMINFGRKGFSVDPSHSGTQFDNFITRSIKTTENDLLKIIEQKLNGT